MDGQLEGLIHKALTHYIRSEDAEFKGLINKDALVNQVNISLPEEKMTSSDIDKFVDQYLSLSVNTHHKKYMNQLWSRVEAPSIAGEFLSTVTNTSMYTYEVAPLGTVLEHKMIQKLGTFIWNNQSCDGVMTSGGTASNLQALLLARYKKYPEVKNKGYLAYGEKTPVILCAATAHYSLKRSINILGLGHEHLIEVPCDNKGKMIIDSLPSLIDKLKSENKDPIALVSTAGTTVEGSYDDITELGKLCQKNDIWFHVDGAYGASVLLSDSHRKLMEGVHLCDSLSWDFHKMIGINLTCAFLLVRDQGLLKNSITTQNDSYLFHQEKKSLPDENLNLGPKSLQCGRRQDIPKLWLSWLSYGRKGLGHRVDRMFQSAKQFAGLVSKHSEFDLLFEPESINICFTLKNASLSEVRLKMQELGLGMINYSQKEDVKFFRMVITRPDYSEEDLAEILANILEARNACK